MPNEYNMPKMVNDTDVSDATGVVHHFRMLHVGAAAAKLCSLNNFCEEGQLAEVYISSTNTDDEWMCAVCALNTAEQLPQVGWLSPKTSSEG